MKTVITLKLDIEMNEEADLVDVAESAQMALIKWGVANEQVKDGDISVSLGWKGEKEGFGEFDEAGDDE